MNKLEIGFDNLIEKAVLLSVFLFPVSILLVKHAGSLIFTLIFLISLPVFLKKTIRQVFSREEKLLFYSCVLIFVAAMFTAWLGGFDNAAWKKMDGFLHFFLIIPVYFLFKEKLKSEKVVWSGLIVATVLVGLVAVYEIVIEPLYGGNWQRARGVTHPIIFGDLALVMCFMLLVAATVIKKWNLTLISLLSIIFIAGLTAVFLSKSRGAWVITPVMVAILFWQLKSLVSKKTIIVSLLVLVSTIVVMYLIPDTGLKQRIDTTVSNIQNYGQGTHKATSIGTRFEMWQAAWQIFQNHPLTGVGWGNYKEAAESLVQKGMVSNSAASWNHPHNQFLSAASNGGLLMLISLLVFTIVPLVLFKRLLLFDSGRVRAYSLAGIVLIIGFIGFGLSESIFERSIPTLFYAFYLALFFAAANKARADEIGKGVKRLQKLSVTVIAYNEADRLGDCLESVAGWADEIIVFDNGSTDGTIELAKKYTDKVFVTDWPGFGKQKQRALDEAQYEWVLSIDADERVTPALQVEIDRALSSDNKEIAYRIPWAVTIYNKRLDFGRSGRAPLRLFKKEGAKFSEASVHEKVLLPAGKVGMLQERLLHYTHRNLNHAVRKFNDYAWLWGTERFEKGRRVTFLAPIFHSLWTFFVIYFLRLGMLDGFRGLVMAVHLSLYTFNKYTVLWTLEKQQKALD